MMIATIPTPINGRTSFTVSPNVAPVILHATNIPAANGGVMNPTHILTKIIAPK